MARRLVFVLSGLPLLKLCASKDLSVAQALPEHYSSAAAVLASDLVTSKPSKEQAQAAGQIVTSFTEAFIGKDISEGESRCLALGAGNITGQLLEACNAAVDTYATSSGSAHVPNTFTVGSATVAPKQKGFAWMPPAESPPAMTGGQEAVFALEFGAKLAAIADLEKFVAKDCLHDDAKKDLETASAHFGDMLFVGGRLLANGVDVLEDLSKASVAYNEKRFEDFGRALGGAWRKVLLARRVNLEIPSPQALVEVTQGFMDSLLDDDLSLHIVADSPSGAVLSASPQLRSGMSTVGAIQNGSPFQPAAQSGESVLDVDLKDCVNNNMPLFQSAWTPVWRLLQSKEKGMAQTSDDIGKLVVSMCDLQVAVHACGIDPRQEAMLFDALHSGNVRSGFSQSSDYVQRMAEKPNALPLEFEAALEEWRERKWNMFGKRLGMFLRQMMTTTFQAKYSLPSDLESKLSPTSSASAGVAFFGCFFLLALSALAAVLRRKTSVSSSVSSVPAAVPAVPACAFFEDEFLTMEAGAGLE
eukprot:TRINITY_DN120802_c0_g1_i1.p1 TRINITY_DN120802_c0_g1~~TRINITY_DN120802_c0_g1_i1.p1  ORF type:complete len:529 (+),score=133.07 TRINITY_DN120802_c0_g1_i1:79-1665(+)